MMKRIVCVMTGLICMFGIAASAWGSAAEDPGVWVDTTRLLQAAVQPYLTSARVEPLCVRKDLEYFRLMVGVADPEIVSIAMTSQNVLKYQGALVGSITFYDDGTHGDEAADDRIFTIDEISVAVMSTKLTGKALIRFRNFTFTYADSSEQVSNEDVALTLHYIDPALPICKVDVLDDDVRRTDYVVSIVQELSGSFPAHYVSNTSVCRRYYDFFADDRDFIMIAKPFNTGSSPAASFGTVRNDVQGIGLAIFDSSGSYGSAGRLQGVMNCYFGNVHGGILTHELLHRWAAFLNSSLDLGRSHWGAIQAGRSGFQMSSPPPYAGSFDHIEHVSENIYRAWNDPQSPDVFNDLELYLMGIVSIDDVDSPIAALVNPNWYEYQRQGSISYSMYTADGMRNVSTGEIIDVEGPRVPDHLNSQKDFRSALVVAYDRPLTAVELTFYDYAMREYEKPGTSSNGTTFGSATGGAADLSTILPISMNMSGFARLASHWLEDDCGSCGGAELTGDGNVGPDDLEVLSDNWLLGTVFGPN